MRWIEGLKGVEEGTARFQLRRSRRLGKHARDWARLLQLAVLKQNWRSLWFLEPDHEARGSDSHFFFLSQSYTSRFSHKYGVLSELYLLDTKTCSAINLIGNEVGTSICLSQRTKYWRQMCFARRSWQALPKPEQENYCTNNRGNEEPLMNRNPRTKTPTRTSMELQWVCGDEQDDECKPTKGPPQQG